MQGCVRVGRGAGGVWRVDPGSRLSIIGTAATPTALLRLRSENALQRMGSIISAVCRRIDVKAICLADRYYSTE